LARIIPTVLSHPIVGGDVPSQLSTNQDAQAARLALLLLEAGILSERYWRRSRKHLQASCQRALTEWLNSHLGGLRCIRPTFTLSIGRSDFYAHRLPEDEQLTLRIEWYGVDADVYVIGPAVEHLERQHPGLGKAVLRELRHASWKSFPVFMCDDQLSIASWVMWGGCENERECIEQQMDDEEAERYLAEVIPHADVVSKVPDWLFGYGKSWEMNDNAIKKILKNTKDEFCAEIAKVMLALREIPMLDEDFHEAAREQGGDFVGFSAVTQWSADDYTVDIVDRFCHYAYEGGEGYECCGIHSQLIDDANAFREWMRKMQTLFTTTRLVDHLLYRLSERDCLNRQQGSTNQ